MSALYLDMVEAGRKLGGELKKLSLVNPLVLAIPRGGVVVACEVARIVGADLDIVVPRKLGAPGEPELAIGAVMHDGSLFLNQDVVAMSWVSKRYIEQEQTRQIDESKRRLRVYRGARPYPTLQGRQVVIVDDGIATGATMIAALRWARARGAERVIAAAPVGPADMILKLKSEADEVVCVHTPSHFVAIGQFYEQFGAVEDEEVITVLKTAWEEG
jgi:predicted phosphoribosyltransferase